MRVTNANNRWNNLSNKKLQSVQWWSRDYIVNTYSRLKPYTHIHLWPCLKMQHFSSIRITEDHKIRYVPFNLYHSLFSDLTSHCSDDLDRLNNQEDSFSDTRLGSLSRPHTHKEPLLNFDMDHPAPPPPDLTVARKENPLSSLSPVPAHPLLQVKVHNKNKVINHLRP